VSRVFSRLVGIVLVTMLARHASTHTVAVYGYLLGTSSLVIALTDLGVASIGGREVAAGRVRAGNALRIALAPQTASLAVAAILTVLLTLTMGPDAVPPAALALTVGCVIFGGINNLIAEVLRGAGRVVLEGMLRMGASISVVVGGVLVISEHGHASALLAVVLGKEMVLLAIGLVLIPPRRAAPASASVSCCDRASGWHSPGPC
jgi:O-antigen/teichoic acid export membrane protein